MADVHLDVGKLKHQCVWWLVSRLFVSRGGWWNYKSKTNKQKNSTKQKKFLNKTATNGTGGKSASVFLHIKLFGSEFCHFDRNLPQGSTVPSNDQLKTL